MRAGILIKGHAHAYVEPEKPPLIFTFETKQIQQQTAYDQVVVMADDAAIKAASKLNNSESRMQ